MKFDGAFLRPDGLSPVSALRRRFGAGRGADEKLRRFGRLLSTAGLSVFLKIGSAGMTFLTTILVARALSATGVGVFALVGVAATIGAIVVSAGFDALSLKLGPRQSAGRTQSRLHRILMIFAIVLPLSAALAIALDAALLAGYGFSWRAVLAPVAVQTVSLGAYRVAASAIQARDGIVLAQMGEQLVRPLVLLGLTGFFVAQGALTTIGLLWIMAASGAACLAYALIVFSFLSGKARARRFRLPPRRLIAGLARSAPSYAGFFAVVLLIEQVDIVLLGVIHGEAAAGVYQPASRVAWLASLGAVAVSIIGRPEIARAAAQRDAGRIVRLMRVYRAAALLYFAGAAAFLAFFAEAIFTLFGEDYEGASAIVFILLFLHGTAALIGPVDAAAQVLGSGEAILARSAAALVVFVLTGLALIPPFGAHGAALAAVAGGVVYRSAFSLYVRKRLRAIARRPGGPSPEEAR